MQATLILCDFADAVNGKLYIVGGGWNLLLANAPAPVALGIILHVPWDQANLEHSLTLELQTEDGQGVSIGEPATPVRQEGKFEVGRPPGTLRGNPLPVTFSIRWPTLPLAPGGYSFVLVVDGEESGRASFRTQG